jgi:E3 ubiquitin-protein ligase MYCBP2
MATRLRAKWPGPRVTFRFLRCPTCNVETEAAALDKILEPLREYRATVHRMMRQRLEHEGLHKAPDVVEPHGAYFNDPVGYAEHMLAYYPCYTCGKPFFGGFNRCEAIRMDEDREGFNPQELLCGGCVADSNVRSCRIHGTEFVEFKCKFCCTVATWYCWGSTHFCTTCHKRQEGGDYLTKRPLSDFPVCKGKATCPLGIDHPPNGTEDFALGCCLCRDR